MTESLAVELARAFTKALEEAQPPDMGRARDLRSQDNVVKTWARGQHLIAGQRTGGRGA